MANETKLGVAPNVGGLLCYVPCCVGFVVSIVAVIIEKENRFVRFHAFQSLLLHGAAIICSIGIQIGAFTVGMVSSILALLFSLLGMVVGLALLVAVVLMMVKAMGNEEYKLPLIGDMASQWANQ